LFIFLNEDQSSGVELKEWVLRGVDALTFDFAAHAVGSDAFLAAIAQNADASHEASGSHEANADASNHASNAQMRATAGAALAARGPRGDLVAPPLQEGCNRALRRTYRLAVRRKTRKWAEEIHTLLRNEMYNII
jgi:hypothetical protein